MLFVLFLQLRDPLEGKADDGFGVMRIFQHSETPMPETAKNINRKLFSLFNDLVPPRLRLGVVTRYAVYINSFVFIQSSTDRLQPGHSNGLPSNLLP